MRKLWFGIWCLVLGISGAWAALPEHPRVLVDTQYDSAYDRPADIVVNAGGDFQKALDDALPGQIIELEAGATFRGQFILKDKGQNSSYIYIRSSKYDQLPPPGIRVNPNSPVNHDDLMPKIVSPQHDSARGAIKTMWRAHHYRFVGIEITTEHISTNFQQTSLIRMGYNPTQNSATKLDDLPHHIIFDRCYIHGTVEGSVRTGIAFNAMYGAVIDSYMSEFHEIGADGGYNIQIINGAGPFKFTNNYFEASGINILFGGTDPKIRVSNGGISPTDRAAHCHNPADPNSCGLVPSDIEIRGNLMTKNLAWRNMNWRVKNIFELKNAQRVLIDGNIFEYGWEGSQTDGDAILFKSTNQSGSCDWCINQDVDFVNNIVRHVSGAVRLTAHGSNSNTSGPSARIRFHNNLFYDINKAVYGKKGRTFSLYSDHRDITITHNTTIPNPNNNARDVELKQPGGINFIMKDNLMLRSGNGVRGDGTAEGTTTLDSYLSSYQFDHNAIIGSANSADYPPNNFFPLDVSAVGFTNTALAQPNHFKLLATSPFAGAASDGTDIGADIDQILAATNCVVIGTCNPPPIEPDPENPEDPETPGATPETEEARKDEPQKFKNIISADYGTTVDIPCNNQIDIYDRRGNLVKRLICSGESVAWDGDEAPSGVYVIDEEDKEPRKVVVIK